MTKFAPKCIIIPATGTYPDDALEVIADDGVTLEAYREGGGYCLSFSGEKRAKYAFREVTEAELSVKWRKGLFHLDLGPDEKPVQGWTTGRRWNGWSTPVFDRDTFKTVLSSFGDYMKWSYDEATDTFTYQCEDDEHPNVERGCFSEELGVTIYATDGWTWSEQK